MLLPSLSISIANVALPTLAQAFSVPFTHVQWVVLAYLLAMTIVIVSVGRLGDVIGRRRLLLSGILLFTLASGLCGVAPTLGLLIAARAAQGVGAAIMMALAMALVGETVPKARTGSAMGLLGTMSAVGTALGPGVGGALIAACGWPAIFLVTVPLGVLALLLARRFLPGNPLIDRRDTTPHAASFDIPGTLLLALTLAAYALAMTTGRGGSGALDSALLIAAVVGAAGFVLVESTVASPLIPLAMFRNPLLASGFAMSALVTTVVMATLVVGPFYLTGALMLDAARVGLVMACGPVASALAGVPAGRIVDRFGARRATTVGLAGMGTGCSIMAFLSPLVPTHLAIPGYIVPLVVITAGYALFQAANNTAVMRDIRPDRRGVTSGMLNLSRNLGLITGASAMGTMFALGAGTIDISTASRDALAAAMRLTFGVAAALIVVAIAVASAGQALARRRGSLT